MTLDVAHHISEVSRTVGTRTLESGEARVLTASRVYPTDVDDLWDAVTNPDRIARWFLPVSGDLRVGGRYSLQGNADGTIEECEPPNRFAATWEFGGQVSWIEVRIEEEDDGQARFTLEHVAHVDDDMWTQFGPGAVGVGWDGALMGLALHVSNNEAAKPTDLEAWAASDEGRAFYGASSAAWRDASIAAGTDPAEAEAAAQRTTSFYTGVEAG
ncbi:MAG TPA: SRPBCC family protein [Acidimicrobiia bacterium]|jgi:uncharacterized protein YndB with AHSA1/START domain